MLGALHAGLLGLLSGSALLAGAAAGYFIRLPPRLIAGVMAAGAGVLVSVIAFDLMAQARAEGGLGATILGFMTGAALYTLFNVIISRSGGEHRKRSGCNPCARQNPHAGLAIAAGALLDGVPESVVVGIATLDGSHGSAVAVAAFFLSNLPEGLSSAAGMKHAGHGAAYVFGVWGTIALASGLAAAAGYSGLGNAPPAAIAATTSLAAGAILAMVVDTMIPEAVDEAHEYTGLLAAAGFAMSFLLSALLG